MFAASPNYKRVMHIAVVSSHLVNAGFLRHASVRSTLGGILRHDLFVGRPLATETTCVLHERHHLVEGNLLALLVERIGWQTNDTQLKDN